MQEILNTDFIIAFPTSKKDLRSYPIVYNMLKERKDTNVDFLPSLTFSPYNTESASNIHIRTLLATQKINNYNASLDLYIGKFHLTIKRPIQG